MTDYLPISCGDYEALEVACMDRYDVELRLADRTLRGLAVGLEVHSGEEFFVIRTSANRTERVRVDQIRHLAVLNRTARFEEHSFGISDIDAK